MFRFRLIGSIQSRVREVSPSMSHRRAARVGLQRSALAIAALLCLGAAAASAATWTVTSTADTNTSGTLRYCLNNYSAGDIINITATGTITLGSTLPAINANVTIIGPGASLLTVSGNNNSSVGSVFIVNSGTTVAISELTIANGIVYGYGGGINNSGTLTVTNSTFSGNSAYDNGSDPSSGPGAGIYNTGTLTVTNSTFSGNNAESGGGGIDNDNNSTLTVTNSTFSGNSANSGGGINNGYNGTLTVTNSTFSGNSVEYGFGGGINNGGTLTVTNSIFSGNSAANAGGGINNNGGTANVSYNVYWDNLASGSEDDCDSCSSNTNAVSASSNPLALPLGYYGGTTETLMPQPGSAAICAGLAADVPSGVNDDQRTWPMPTNCPSGSVDAGAVQTNYLTVTTLTDKTDGSPDCTSGTGTTCSLRDAIGIANTYTADDLAGGDIAFLSSLTSTSAPGTINLATGTNTALPSITGVVNILGPGANQLTVSGGNSTTVGTVLTVNSGATATLYGLTIADGNVNSSDGGGIANSGTLTLLADAVSNNTAANGYNGGGIVNNNSGSLTMTDSTVSGNSATLAGGGIENGGTLTMTDSTVSGNSATYAGGGIFGGGTLTITDSTVSGNSVSSAVNNVSGGGIANSGTLILANSIVEGNSVSGSIASYADIDGSYTDNGGNLASKSSSATTLDPGLSPLQYNGLGATVQTMIPLPGSPAICAGLQSEIPAGVTTDERGYPNTNTSYTGYSSSSPCVDTGAVQTNYTGVLFAQQPTNTEVNTAITPSPSVEVQETNANTDSTDAVGGVPVTLTYSGGSGEIGGTLTEPPTGTGGIATFSGLTPNTTGTGFTLSTDEMTVVGSDTLASVSSGDFDVTNPLTLTAGGTVTYMYGGAAVALDPAVTVSDASGSTLAGATLAIASGFSSGDILNFTNQNGITGTYNATTGVLTLTGNATVADYRAALASVAFSTGSTSPTPRSIDWTVTDGVANSAIVASTVDVDVAPTVTGISPTSGTTLGGTAVTITGTNFTGATVVTFGTTAPASKVATNVIVVSDTEITATAPAGAAGTVNVFVTNPVGTSAISTADQFVYAAPATATVAINASATYSASAQIVTLTATVTSGAGTVNEGTVTFTVSGIGSPATGSVSNGAATVSYTLPAGTSAATYTLDTQYSDTAGTFASSSDSSHTLTVNPASQTINFTAPSSPVTYGVSPITLQAAGGASGNAIVFSVVSGPGSVTGSALTVTGTGTIVVAANQAEDTNYSAATQVTQTIAVNQATLDIAANSATRIYGTANPTFTGTVTGQQNSDTFTESFSTTATLSSPVTTYTIVPSVTGTNLADYTQSVADGTLTVTQAASTTSLGVSSGSITPGQSVTLTATVADASSGSTGAPTGTVNFYDGTTLLNATPVQLIGDAASYPITTLAPGMTHALTATYSGDPNFTGSTTTASASVTVAPLDFTMTIAGPNTATVVPGSTITYKVTVTPDYGSYAGTVNFAVSGLPPGATTTFSPSSIASTGGPQTITVTIQIAPESALVQAPAPPASHPQRAPLALALLGLFGLGGLCKRRRALRRLLCVLALVAAGAATLSLSGCGSGNGYFAQAQQNYTVTITATAGSLQHTSTVTLNVQ